MQAGDCLQILREIKDVSFASVDEQADASASANRDYRNEQRVSDGAPAGALDSSVTAGVLDSSYF
mgnify:CR=1 FL=1